MTGFDYIHQKLLESWKVADDIRIEPCDWRGGVWWHQKWKKKLFQIYNIFVKDYEEKCAPSE